MDYVIIASLSIFLLLVFLISPRQSRERFAPFLEWDYAHRGLHDNTGSAPENSLLAIQLAVEKGYGIEFDVRLSKDKQVVVFHDSNLQRTSGNPQMIEQLTYQELRHHYLFSSEENIPLLEHVLKQVNGVVPLIIELKSENTAVSELCQRVAKQLKNYSGYFLIESFNPLVIAYFKKHYPQYLRGQLSGGLNLKKGFVYFLVRNLLTNFLTRPDFIAYEEAYQKNLILHLLGKVFQTPLIVYTVKNKDSYKKNQELFDLQIFEGFEP